MGKEGPAAFTVAKVEKVKRLLREGNKLTWSLAEAGLACAVWYRWAGWKRVGPYNRDVYCDKRVLDRKIARVRQLVEGGMRLTAALRFVGVSYWTYHSRRKKERAAG